MKKSKLTCGQKINNILLLDRVFVKKRKLWKCICDCGQIFFERETRLNGTEKRRNSCFKCDSNNWTENQISYLKSNFKNTNWEALSENLNKSKGSIRQKASRLKLKRNISFKRDNLIKLNKLRGRDLNDETLKEISKKYISIQQLREKDKSAYSKIKSIGIDKFCGHLLNIKTSVPQLILNEILKKILKCKTKYNSRKIIYPYELDVYIPKYKLAFEYDGSYWHKNNKNDKIKNDLCKNQGIKLYRITENNKNDYILDIKTQIINIISELNHDYNLKLNKDKIVNINIDVDFIKEKHLNIFKKYKSMKTFAIKNYSLYRKLKKYKLIMKYCSHMDFDIPKNWKSPI